MAIFIEEKSEIGKLIWTRLKSHGKTQKWLAQELGCSYVTLSKICDGNIKNPSFKLMMKISDKLDIPPKYLFTALNEKGD